VTRAATRERLDQALTRLLAGQPAVTGGELTVSNLCKEAGVGRDSYYRTPQAVARFTAARTTAGTPGTELARLRDQLAALTREIKDRKRDHAALTSELEDQVRTYAGQIQVVALACQELREENQRLRNQIERADPGVSQLHPRRKTGDE
jgi:chromosome segregation ATPase